MSTAEEKRRLRERVYRWRKKNRELSLKRHRAYESGRHKRNPELLRKRTQKRRALLKRSTVGDVAAIYEWEKWWRSKKAVKCHWCGKWFPTRCCHSDHVVPLSGGGEHSLDNLCVACSKCNQSKNAKSPSNFNSTLKQPLLFF